MKTNYINYCIELGTDGTREYLTRNHGRAVSSGSACVMHIATGGTL